MNTAANAWALVTGASGGIGRDMAELLAQRGYNIMAVARGEDKLNELAQQLQDAHGVRVRVIAHDLGVAGSVAHLMNRIGSDVADIEVLINNAGFGVSGLFADADSQRTTEMIQLNVLSLTELTRAVVPSMKARGKGYVMNVASAVAFQPCPHFAVYGATKAFVLSFSQALHVELSGTGVSVTAVCPGSTATDFHRVAGSDRTLVAKIMDSSAAVAREGVDALFARRSSVVTGLMNKPLPLVNRLVPRMWMANLVGAIFSGGQRKAD